MPMFSKSSGRPGRRRWSRRRGRGGRRGAPRHVDDLLRRRRQAAREDDDGRRRAAGEREHRSRARRARASSGTARRRRSRSAPPRPAMPSTARCTADEIGRRADIDLPLRREHAEHVARRQLRGEQAHRLPDLGFAPRRDRVVVDQDVNDAAAPADRVGRVGRRQADPPAAARRRRGVEHASDWIGRGLPLTLSAISSGLQVGDLLAVVGRARGNRSAPARWPSTAPPPARRDARAEGHERRREERGSPPLPLLRSRSTSPPSS